VSWSFTESSTVSGWTYSISINGSIQSGTSGTFDLAGNTAATVIVTVNPNGTDGTGTAFMTFTESNNSIGTVSYSYTTTTEPKGNLEIIFKARYEMDPLILFQNNSTGQSDPTIIIFKKLDFFISNIKGTTNNGTPTDFTDVGYISMANSLGTISSEDGTIFSINNLPIGNYNQLQLGIGLSDATNSTNPGSYPSSSPLGLNSNYWASWDSYILCKIEGDIIQSNNTNSGFLYHAGVNGMSQNRVFNNNFMIEDGKTTQLVIHINANDIFFKIGAEIDLINDNQTHSGTLGSTEYNLAKTAIENLANSLTLIP
jgi:hypothetical protein